MTYQNGRLPVGALTELVSVPGKYLSAAAAHGWDTAAASLGWTPTIVAGGAYRTLAAQVSTLQAYYTTTPTPAERAGASTANGRLRTWDGKAWYRRAGKPTAATPGTSNHGTGCAVDAGRAGTSFQRFDDPYRLQLLDALAPHGWRDTEGRKVSEPWHFTYYPEYDTHPAPTQEDDMFTDDDRARMIRIEEMLVRNRQDDDKLKAATERNERRLQTLEKQLR